jgi:hypothetical protein
VPRSHPSLLVDDDLARAIRHESAAALQHWWGVSDGVVTRRQIAFGVDRVRCEGTHRLMCAASEQGAARTRGVKLPPEAVKQRRRTTVELGYVRRIRPGYNLGPRWTRRALALLGKLPDDEVAARIGRTPNAVRIRRTKLGTPTACGRRRRG